MPKGSCLHHAISIAHQEKPSGPSTGAIRPTLRPTWSDSLHSLAISGAIRPRDRERRLAPLATIESVVSIFSRRKYVLFLLKSNRLSGFPCFPCFPCPPNLWRASNLAREMHCRGWRDTAEKKRAASTEQISTDLWYWLLVFGFCVVVVSFQSFHVLVFSGGMLMRANLATSADSLGLSAALDASVGFNRWSLTRADVLLCVLPIALFLSIVSLV